MKVKVYRKGLVEVTEMEGFNKNSLMENDSYFLGTYLKAESFYFLQTIKYLKIIALKIIL